MNRPLRVLFEDIKTPFHFSASQNWKNFAAPLQDFPVARILLCLILVAFGISSKAQSSATDHFFDPGNIKIGAVNLNEAPWNIMNASLSERLDDYHEKNSRDASYLTNTTADHINIAEHASVIEGLTATFSHSNVSCHGGSNGAATITVSGGVAPYTYSWSPSGPAIATISGLSAGIYTVTVTDADGSTIDKSVTISQPNVLTATIYKEDANCHGFSNGRATVTALGGAAPYTYSWSPAGGTAALATGLEAGTYTVTITDANFCQIDKTIAISQPEPLTINAIPNSQTICSGDTAKILLTASRSVGFEVYGVSSGDVYGWTMAEYMNGSFINDVLTGDGIVNYQISTLDGCPPISITVPITVKPNVTVISGPGNKSVDTGESASFSVSASGAVGYQWQVNTGSGFSNIADTPPYSGSTTTSLQVGSTTEAMNGYTYRCLISGSCDSTVESAAGTLTVTTKLAQTITFNPIGEKVYGSADFVPQASSSSGLEITFSSSDPSIAEIVNGKIHIRKAGEVTITASQDGNTEYYAATGVQHLLTITKKPLDPSISSILPITKVYDGTTAITIDTSKIILQGKIAGDDVSAKGTAHLDDTQAGDNNMVTIDNLQLVGAGKDNYSLTLTSLTAPAAILKKNISVFLDTTIPIQKVYDGNTSVSTEPVSIIIEGKVVGDTIYVNGIPKYIDSKAGPDKSIIMDSLTITGVDAGNYTFTQTQIAARGTITKKNLSISFNPNLPIQKVYNGRKDMPLSSDYFISDGLAGNDSIAVTASALFWDENAGTGKHVMISNYQMAEIDKGNYHIAGPAFAAKGDIHPKPVALTLPSGAELTKVYNNSDTISIRIDSNDVAGREPGDEVWAESVGKFNNKNAGDNKAVTLREVVFQGADKNNYILAADSFITAGTIKPKPVTATLRTNGVVIKVYDGNADARLTSGHYRLQNHFVTDQVGLGNYEHGEFDSKHAGVNKTVTVRGLALVGRDSANYRLEQTELRSAIGVIQQKNIFITAEPQTKQYGNDDSYFRYSADSLMPGDELPGSLQRAIGEEVGEYAIGQGSLSGGTDYTIVGFNPSALNITPAQLLIRAEDKTRRKGEPNPVFTFTYDGFAQGDDSSVLLNRPIAATTAASGSPVGEYEISVSGAVSGNYTFTYKNGKLTVAPADEENHTVRVWSSSREVLHMNIISDIAQPAAIVLYTNSGQPVKIVQKNLSPGSNSFSLQLGNVSAGGYSLRVRAQTFDDAQRVSLR